MSKETKFIKDNLLPSNTEIEETPDHIDVKHISVLKVVGEGGKIIVSFGGKSITFIIGGIIKILYGVMIVPDFKTKFYNMLGGHFKSTSSIKDPDIKKGIGNLIESGDLGLAQKLIEGQNENEDET